jgi:tRNA (guanine-N7-)-methyltransferase
MQDFLPRLQIDLPAKGLLNPLSLFPSKSQEIWLEIGFGGGEHLAAIAGQNPQHGCIGAEPFVNGIASLLDHIEKDKIANIRIFTNDARMMLDVLPDHSISRCFVLFADPWPKARHAERRFIGPENLPRLARVLKAGAELQLATDDVKLAAWMLEHMNADKNFDTAYAANHAPPPDWVPTRYEQKALKAGRKPVYVSYRRKPV